MDIKVIIVDDDPEVRTSLERFLGMTPGLQCLRTMASVEQALRDVPQLRPDVLLLDVHLPDGLGLECLGPLKKRLPDLRIIMLTGDDGDLRVKQALMAGADGYLVKGGTLGPLAEAIREVCRGGAVLSGQITQRMIQQFRMRQSAAGLLEQLTPAEATILGLMAQGLANKDIAFKAGTSVETVRTHARHIYEKLNVHSRTEAVLIYLGRE